MYVFCSIPPIATGVNNAKASSVEIYACHDDNSPGLKRVLARLLNFPGSFRNIFTIYYLGTLEILSPLKFQRELLLAYLFST